MLLKVNRSLWDSTTVSKAMGGTSLQHDEVAGGNRSTDSAPDDDDHHEVVQGYDIAIDIDDEAEEEAEH